jgi:hypothetical protein
VTTPTKATKQKKRRDNIPALSFQYSLPLN